MNSLMLMITTITTISVMWLVVGAPATANNSILSICKYTQYQKLCRQSLTPYAGTLTKKPCHLPFVAVSLALIDAKKVSQYVQKLKDNYTNNQNISAGALNDCAELLDEMVDQIRDSRKETRLLFANKSSQGVDPLHVSNVKTWMSAALTDSDDTCADELEHLNVGNGISRVRCLLSNALAIINYTYGN